MFRVSSIPVIGGALVCTLASPAMAGDGELEQLVYKIQLAMNAENWAGAITHCDAAITRFGKDDPMRAYGPQFGAIHYRRGLCELQLGNWDEAMRSFEICYRDFPNKPGTSDNPFEKLALLKWAEAAMGAKRWELAIAQFRKFLKERDPARDTYSHGAFYVGLAVCFYQLGRIPEGNENLEIALRNRERFGTPESPLAAGFQTLVTTAIARKDEQALLDFIGKNRAALVLAPQGLLTYSPLMMKLAGDAVAAGMPRAALAIYQLVPPVESALRDAREQLKQSDAGSTERGKLEATITALENAMHGEHPPDVARLTAIAMLNEQTGHPADAYKAWVEIERSLGRSPLREEILMHLTRLSSQTGSVAETRRHAEEFIRSFPDSPNTAIVRRLLLTSLFQNADYDACIGSGESMLAALKPGTPEHDDVLFALAASLHYRARHEEARPLLDEHVRLYPQGAHAMQASYLQACNETRLRQWERAAGLLEAFLSKFPDASVNPWLANALCDLATCQTSLGRPDAALECLVRATDPFPDGGIAGTAWMMRADLEQSLGKPDAAEKSYLKALEFFRKHDDREGSERALAGLVVLLARDPLDDARADHAARFAGEYRNIATPGSPDQTRVAISAASALDHLGRTDEALTLLREHMLRAARTPASREFEALVQSYSGIHLRHHGPADLLERFDASGFMPENSPARATLYMAVIVGFEDLAGRSNKPEEKQSAETSIQGLFERIRTGFQPKDLGNYTLVRIGDHIRKQDAAPDAALAYYDELIARPDDSFRFAALMGRADLRSRSTDPAVIGKAIADYERVFNESPDAAQREVSLYQTIVLLIAVKDYPKAAETARFYLNPGKSGFSRFVPQVRLCLARSLDERKMVDEAIEAYAGIGADFADQIGVSAPAMQAWLRLIWERGKPGDRKTARDGGRGYLNRTSPLQERMSPEDRELWNEVETLVKSLEARPDEG